MRAGKGRSMLFFFWPAPVLPVISLRTMNVTLTSTRSKLLSTGLIALLSLLRGRAADPFAENVRTTEPLAPELEQKSFHLPPGFEIQLVAAEPDLRKPMNMAFDAAGRLWITESREYPIFAKPGQPMR